MNCDYKLFNNLAVCVIRRFGYVTRNFIVEGNKNPLNQIDTRSAIYSYICSVQP